MRIECVIPGRLPGLNDLIGAERIHRQKGAKLKKDSESIVRPILSEAFHGYRPTKPVTLHYVFYEPNSRRDKDNVASYAMKIIQDSLVKEGILENDNWKYVVGFTCEFGIDKANPRIELTVEE